jgi:hypothetical protein
MVLQLVAVKPEEPLEAGVIYLARRMVRDSRAAVVVDV